MRLRQFHVRGFKCIRDSGPVSIGDIAALVGKNESGKTALLEAPIHLNKDSPISELDLCDDIHENLKDNTVIIEGLFDLSPAESAKILSTFPSVPLFTKVSISRRYKSSAPFGYQMPGVDFPKKVEFVADKKPEFLASVATLKAEITSFYSLLSADARETATADQKAIDTAIDELTKPETPTKVDLAKNFQTLSDLLKAKVNAPFVPLCLKKMADAIASLHRPVDVEAQVRKYIFDNFHPKFVYFSEYREIYGTVHLPTYLAGSDSPTPVSADTGLSFDKKVAISNLFKLAGLDPTYLENNKKNPQLRGRNLRECSQRLTSALAKTWKTQKIEIDLEYGIGDVLTVQICDVLEDGTRSNYGHLSRRSQGFRWHFSFYVISSPKLTMNNSVQQFSC